MMIRMFRDKIGRTVEVYIDDMMVKSKRKMEHIDDLKKSEPRWSSVAL